MNNDFELLTTKELRKIYDDVMFTGASLPKVRIKYNLTRGYRVITPEHQEELRKAATAASIKDMAQSFVYRIMKSIDEQENPKNRKITECEIIPNGYVHEVWIKSDCDGWCEDVKELFSYYPDELHFSAYEFIGLTEKRAVELFHERDIAYLRR